MSTALAASNARHNLLWVLYREGSRRSRKLVRRFIQDHGEEASLAALWTAIDAGEVPDSDSVAAITELIHWIVALPDDDGDLRVLGALLPNDPRRFPSPDSWQAIQNWGLEGSETAFPEDFLERLVEAETAAALEGELGR